MAVNPKGTVPVLQLPQGRVIAESRDILTWALAQRDPEGIGKVAPAQAEVLIDQNDQEFKYWLDRYKYFERYPEQSQQAYLEQGERFLRCLETLLQQHRYLLGDTISKADLAVVPFVRQFAHVDREVFYALPYPHVQRWLRHWLAHPVFVRMMKKYPPWKAGDEPLVFQ